MATDEGRLLVRIEAQIRQFEKAMAQATGGADRAARKIETRFRTMERTLGGIGGRLGTALGVSIGVASFRQLASAIGETVQKAAGLVDLADKIGITTDALQELRFQADQQGSSAEALDSALEQFSKRIGEAAAGSGELLKILTANNIALRDGEGNLRPLSDLLADYADLVKNAANDQDRAVLATKAFGRAGDEMASVLRGGSAELETFKTKAHELSQVVGEEGLRALEDFDDELARLQGRWSSAMTSMTVLLLKFLEKVGEVEHAIVDSVTGASDETELQGVERQLAAIPDQIAKLQQAAADGLIPAEGVAADIARLQALQVELQNTLTTMRVQGGGVGQGAFGGRPPAAAAATTTTSTTIPRLGGGGGGGPSPAEQFREDIAAIKARTEALRVETSVVGESVFEQERALAVQDLLNQAKRLGVEITPQLRAEIEAEAAAYARSVEALELTEERFRAINDLAQEFGTQAIDAFEGLIDGTKSLNESLADSVKMIRRMVLEALLLGQGPLAGLLGGGSAAAGGGVGGLLGKLLASVASSGAGGGGVGGIGGIGSRGALSIPGPGSAARTASGASLQVVVNNTAGAEVGVAETPRGIEITVAQRARAERMAMTSTQRRLISR